MNVPRDADAAAAGVAAAIGAPARARMLFCLLDGRARTGIELAAIAEVSPSTASVHLHTLEKTHLVKNMRQGKHRYYSLSGPDVASVLEGLNVLAGGLSPKFVSRTPDHLRMARTCYDHMAGTIGVALHDRFQALGWLWVSRGPRPVYDVSPDGIKAFGGLGIDLDAARSLRRRFVCGCLDWSERRYHLGGALGAAFLAMARKRKWVSHQLDSRALRVTELGRREMSARFGV